MNTCMRRFTFLIAFVLLPCLLTSCVTDSGDPTYSALRITPKNKIWVAFLAYHTRQYPVDPVAIKEDTSVALLGNAGRKLTVTHTPDDTRMAGPYASSPLGYLRQLLPSESPESVIMASGDPELIQLHQKLKAIEQTIASSSEYSRFSTAASQSQLVKQAYSANYQQPGGDTPLEVLQNGGTVADLHAAHDRENAAGADRDSRQARLSLLRQQDKIASKADTEYNKAAAALQAFRSKHGIPTDEVLNAMRRYVPPGSKGWNTNTPLSILFYGDGGGEMLFEYGTWTY